MTTRESRNSGGNSEVRQVWTMRRPSSTPRRIPWMYPFQAMKRPPAQGSTTASPPPVNAACSRPSIQAEKTRCGSAATTVSTSKASGISTPNFAVYESGSPSSTFPLTHAPHQRWHAPEHHTEPSSEIWGHNTDLRRTFRIVSPEPWSRVVVVCVRPDWIFSRGGTLEVKGFEVTGDEHVGEGGHLRLRRMRMRLLLSDGSKTREG